MLLNYPFYSLINSNLYIAKLAYTNIIAFTILKHILCRPLEICVSKLSNKSASDLADMQKHASEAAGLLKQLGNENRLLILCTLIDGELSVGELNEIIPLSQSALSQHLASLRDAGLVETRRESQTIFYSLCGTEAIQVISVLQSIYCP